MDLIISVFGNGQGFLIASRKVVNELLMDRKTNFTTTQLANPAAIESTRRQLAAVSAMK
jgi:ribosomal protein L29